MKLKMMDVCVLVFFYTLSGYLLSDVSTPQEANEVTSSVLVSLNDLPGDALIARVLEQNVYLKDINPSPTQIEKYGSDKTPEQLEEWKRQHQRSNLSHYFWLLFEHYAQEKDIEVTETDIEQYNQSMLRGIKRQVEDLEKKADSLHKELQADNLDDKKRSELTERLELYTNYANRLNESQETFKKPNNPAGTMIRLWKIYNQLYEQYGGRVIFQQAGPEPLDAFRMFLEDQQRQGNFEFFNKEAEDLFWEYYRNEKMHTFYSDAAEAKKMMETPWWLRAPEESPAGDDADLWGEAVDGLCMKIRPQKGGFYVGEGVSVIVDMLNTGDTIFMCSSWQQFFEIEVDGQWYRWCGFVAVDITAGKLRPKKVHYEFARITLTEEWESKETALPLKLDIGPHSVRFRYRPMYVKMDKSDLKSVQATIAVTSNLVKFNVSLPKKPISVLLEGPPETADKIRAWLESDPQVAKSVLGQKYIVKVIPPKPNIDHKMTLIRPNPEIDFKIGIFNPYGNKSMPELTEKLAEAIRKQMQEESDKQK